MAVTANRRRATVREVELLEGKVAMLLEENAVMGRRLAHVEAELRGALAAVKHVKGEAGSLRDSNAFLVEERKELGQTIGRLEEALEERRAKVVQMDQQLLDLRRNHAGELSGCQVIIRQWEDRAAALGVVKGIFEERVRQVVEEGFEPERDDEYRQQELAAAAAAYAAPSDQAAYAVWPRSWSLDWFKRGKHSRRRQLEIASALLLAEMERLDRKEQRERG